mgnify:CR=1 FL=1
MIGSAIVLCIVVYFTNIPLGIPSDWVWSRHQQITFPIFEFITLSMFLAISIFFTYVIRKHTRNMKEIWVCVALILGCGMFTDYYMMQVGKFGINENIFGILDKYTGGYMTSAANIKEPGKYLSNFHLLLERDEDKSNHLDVHPPGNVMLSYIVLQCCRNSPLPHRILNTILPEAVFKELQTARHDGVFQDVPDNENIYTAAAFMLLLMTVGITLARLLIILSAINLCRYRGNLGLAALLAAVTVPSSILFLGHYDVLMFFLGALCFYTFTLKKNEKRGFYWDALTGFLLGISVLFSLAFGAMILLYFLYCFCMGFTERRYWLRGAAIASGGLIVILLCYCFNIRIIQICYYAARNNGRYFAEAGRSMFWGPVNLLDYLLFGGVFLFYMPLSEISRVSIHKLRTLKNKRFIMLACYLAILLFLLVSPFSRGEMGRLLLFFKPCGLILSTSALMRKKLDDQTWYLFIIVAILSLLLIFLSRITLKLIMIL